MIHAEITKKLEAIIEAERLDALVIGGVYNIQYATGVRIPSAHAQPDLAMFAIFANDREPVVLVPACWESVARQTCYFQAVRAYGSHTAPLAAAVETVVALCKTAKRVGLDSECLPVSTLTAISRSLADSGATVTDCGGNITAARTVKTDTEIEVLEAIAYKNDHIINGHFHHLSADRPKTASSTSESLRVHSLERDIEISGYNACSRAVIGDSMSQFWAYAPTFGFADPVMTSDNDPIVAEVLNTEDGYWSNAARIAVSGNQMTEAQEQAYGQLNHARELLLGALETGRKGCDVYRDVIEKARNEGLTLVENLALGFSVGVSPKEPPFLSAGETRAIKTSMVLVLDPVVRHGGLYYRSRDTVIMRDDGPEIVNWYKDWREPYLAILAL